MKYAPLNVDREDHTLYQKTYVYLMSTKGDKFGVKIGISNNMGRRLIELQEDRPHVGYETMKTWECFNREIAYSTEQRAHHILVENHIDNNYSIGLEHFSVDADIATKAIEKSLAAVINSLVIRAEVNPKNIDAIKVSRQGKMKVSSRKAVKYEMPSIKKQNKSTPEFKKIKIAAGDNFFSSIIKQNTTNKEVLRAVRIVENTASLNLTPNIYVCQVDVSSAEKLPIQDPVEQAPIIEKSFRSKVWSFLCN